MAKRKYTVSGPFPVLEHRPGESFSAEINEEQETYLLEQGLLERGDGDGKGAAAAAPTKVACPACVEQGLKTAPKFDEIGAMQDHYAEKHPALVAPAELPAPEGEED